QHFLDIAQAQIEAEVEPDSTGHDFDRIAVVLAVGALTVMGRAATLTTPSSILIVAAHLVRQKPTRPVIGFRARPGRLRPPLSRVQLVDDVTPECLAASPTLRSRVAAWRAS
ncbi:hypothetical protein, partial [Mesorhizobium sp. M0159]|uniref:hypothetical protein n=1 Tax=Mesorhizobium sp. M0159 TaxID=2956900 RepID=UPI003336EAB2